MCTKLIALLLLQTIFCRYIPQNMTEVFLNATRELNLTDIEKNIKAHEREYIYLYKYASYPENRICSVIEKSIKSLYEVREKYAYYVDIIQNCKVRDNETKKYFDLRGDILFGHRNVEIAIGKLNLMKNHCYEDYVEMEKAMNERNQKNKKSKEDIVKAVNHIIQIENGL